ncbi:MAG TPA: hypothetical protein VE821_11055 [Pyrinomonadaceae bacterium]|nr:hypothetical protein [Pyrinomonadaceae bacterium]
MPNQMSLAADSLALAPLGAGDLIDRTIRLYRQHFLTLIRTAAPPVVASAIGAVLFTISWRGIGVTESSGRLALYVVGVTLGWVLSVSGPFFLLIILGGASRNLVAHLLWQEPVSARTIYRNVRTRFWGLFGAMLVTAVCAALVGSIIFIILLFALGLTFSLFSVVMVSGGGSEALSILIILLTLLCALLALLCFFWVMGHLAYVPQVMMIEGRKVFDAISRSISLARGNARRLLAMFLFTTFATYSALMLLLIPLGWYGYLHGINPFTLSQAEWPVWYAIGYQVVGQVASILLMPVWMLGLSLLYVDERVRHEGYDIELLAARRLGEMPTLPDGRVAPLAPALVESAGLTSSSK